MIARAFPTTIFPWIQIGFKEKMMWGYAFGIFLGNDIYKLFRRRCDEIPLGI